MSKAEVTKWLDEGPWSDLQKRVLGLSTLAVILDGVDIPILGLAIPSLAKDWAIFPSDFALTVAGGMVGMGIGTTVAGVLGDRYGRRPVLIFSLSFFGAMTMGSALCHDVMTLALFRTFAGLGLGGTLPNATAMIAEYTPKRYRTTAVTLGNASSQAGGIIAGVVATAFLLKLGWRGLFAIGGFIPLVFAALLFFFLPESPRYLLNRLHSDRLTEILDRIGYRGSRDFSRGSGQSRSLTVLRNYSTLPSISELFKHGRAVDTLFLWASFFACYVAVFIMPNWLPTMLTHIGYSSKLASTGMAAYNAGGLVGGIIGAIVTRNLGLRTAAAAMGMTGAVWAAILTTGLDHMSGNHLLTICCVGFQGFFVIGVMVMLITVASEMYPTAIRSTGIGTALASARVGAIASAYLGSIVLETGKPSSLFIVIGIAMGSSALLSFILSRPSDLLARIRTGGFPIQKNRYGQEQANGGADDRRPEEGGSRAGGG
jgi:AAHS family 4-hydroxybenzoate transporter-like MFS transporter